MPQPAYTRTAILQAIREHGPLTAVELAAALELSRTAINGALTEARAKYGTQFFRITAWRRYTGRGSNWVPVYGLGPGEDEPKPVLTKEQHNERQVRYRERMRDVIRIRDRARRGKQPTGPWAQLLS